jgi:hypothetical protein
MTSRVAAAVERALDDRQREATEEVERILAVMERGAGIVVSYLHHQMAKEARPEDKIARWIEARSRKSPTLT